MPTDVIKILASRSKRKRGRPCISAEQKHFVFIRIVARFVLARLLPEPFHERVGNPLFVVAQDDFSELLQPFLVERRHPLYCSTLSRLIQLSIEYLAAHSILLSRLGLPNNSARETR